METVLTSVSTDKRIRLIKRRIRRHRARKGVIFLPLILIAVVILLVSLFMPILQVNGSSMMNTLSSGDTVLVMWNPDYESGDIIAFRCQSKILMRRVIAGPGSIVDIDELGNVTVDGVLLEEPYVTEKAQGLCTITFPCQIPEGHYFVLGDKREISVDSRSGVVGFVSHDDILGRVILVLWPVDSFGTP